MKKVILVDGNNLIFRSYFATAYTGNIMKNSKGFPTNALYGFISMINKIINEEKPEYILVAFNKGKTFRHEKYKEYKAGRNATPEELKLQIPIAKDILDAWGIKYYEIDNYEADDIIGTVAKMVDNEDKFVATIVSSDKDLLQLISDEVDVKLLKKKDFIRMDKKVFKDTYGVDPIRMIDLKALMGDSSDNIPGVSGIGEKTAISLLTKYDNLDNLYKHIDEVTGKTKEKLINDKENAYKSFDLATIYRDVKLDFDLEDLKYVGINKENLKKILEDLEFKSFIRKFDLDNTLKDEKAVILPKKLVIKDIKDLDSSKPYAFYVEVDNLYYSKGNVIGISFYDGENTYFLDVEEIDKYKKLFENSTKKATYDLKKAIVVLDKYNIKVKNVLYDAMIGTYLLDYDVKDDISVIANEFAYDIEDYVSFYGTEKRKKEVDKEKLINYLGKKVQFIYETKEEILKEIEKEDMLSLFTDIEMPLSVVLADMELTGNKVDKDYLDKVATDLQKKIEVITKEIYELAGTTFNISSPKQLSEVLFIKLEIPYPKKVKNNTYSTSKDILDKVLDAHPIVSKVLEYRTLTKIYTNYAEGLKAEIRDDGKIHTIYTQTLTRTGRLSSINPNLQNIPSSDDYSKLIRSAFIPNDNAVLLSSDYSQIELRVFAHMSKCKNMAEAFKEHKDIHTTTASKIFNVPFDKVTHDMRRAAKAVNFGILYGMSSFGLSEDLNIDIKDAKKFMDKYLETFEEIVPYTEQLKASAYENGFVKTLYNRKRYIHELANKNYMIRQAGERMALNTPIQGTAADILKMAMVKLYKELTSRNLKSKILLQVHDELILNVVEEEVKEVKKLVKDTMENIVKLDVPLEVSIAVGANWYEAK